MPVVDRNSIPPVKPSQMADWKELHRIEDADGNVDVVANAIQTYPFQRLVYAEGDSWFDKFTPLLMRDTNLLSALRLPIFAGMVDVSHIGDTAEDMVTGHQRRQTTAMFKLFDFDAILLSAGGNDLKNLFATLYFDVAEQREHRPIFNAAALVAKAQRNEPVDEFFDQVIKRVSDFIAMRNASRRERTRRAPLLLHGYDYLQPRPAPATIFGGSRLGSGPWLYPALKHAGLSDAEMLTAATSVIDELNGRLARLVQAMPADASVHLLDQRGMLDLAAPKSTARSGDWLDEIHPTPEGFDKLAQGRWNPWLANVLGLL